MNELILIWILIHSKRSLNITAFTGLEFSNQILTNNNYQPNNYHLIIIQFLISISFLINRAFHTYYWSWVPSVTASHICALYSKKDVFLATAPHILCLKSHPADVPLSTQSSSLSFLRFSLLLFHRYFVFSETNSSLKSHQSLIFAKKIQINPKAYLWFIV